MILALSSSSSSNDNSSNINKTDIPLKKSLSQGSATISSTTKTQNKTRTSSTNSFGASGSIDILLQAQHKGEAIISPPDNLKDKIHFIVNNVDINFRAKAIEMKEILKENYYAYLCQYLVIRRVSVETKFQDAYATWLQVMDLPKLSDIMLKTTYTNINILINSKKILKQAGERSLLKNLGNWLGLLTVANDKPILHKYINVRELILKAYESERLVAVLPCCYCLRSL